MGKQQRLFALIFQRIFSYSIGGTSCGGSEGEDGDSGSSAEHFE